MKKWSDPIKIKKIFVLAALLTEESKSQKNPNPMTMDKVSRFLDTPWRPAEAWHYFILAQQQFQQGKLSGVMATAIKLQDYVDILDEEDVFSMLALASALNKCFGVCSKAFTCLESIPRVSGYSQIHPHDLRLINSPLVLSQLSPSDREDYQQLALDIFTKYPPKDGRYSKSECPQCGNDIQDW